jgi:hypothetical protein
MNQEKFNKAIDELKALKLTKAEKSAMLSNILSAPIPSPYARHVKVFAYVRKFSSALPIFLIAVIASGSLAYASERSLPGEKLYAVKTKIIEPLVNTLNFTPEQKLEWESTKVERRIVEAEDLIKKNKLDEDKTKVLEKAIEKSTTDFATVAEKVSAAQATTTEGKKEREEKFKQDFKEKLEDKRDKDDSKVENEKIKRLKEKAVETLERKNSGKNREKGE